MTTDPAAAAAKEIDELWEACKWHRKSMPSTAAIIRRHFAEANAVRQAAVERLVDAAESLRAEVATIVNDPDETDLPGLEDAYCRTIRALDAVRSLPPDPQDAALTAERDALLRRAVELIASDALESRHAVAADFRRRWLADAARLGITGAAK